MFAFFDGVVPAGAWLKRPVRLQRFGQAPVQHATDDGRAFLPLRRCHIRPACSHQNDCVHVVVIILQPVLAPAHRIIHILQRE